MTKTSLLFYTSLMSSEANPQETRKGKAMMSIREAVDVLVGEATRELSKEEILSLAERLREQADYLEEYAEDGWMQEDEDELTEEL